MFGRILVVVALISIHYFAETKQDSKKPATKVEPSWTKQIETCEANITYEKERYKINNVRVVKKMQVKFTKYNCSVNGKPVVSCDLGKELKIQFDVHKVMKELQDYRVYIRTRTGFMKHLAIARRISPISHGYLDRHHLKVHKQPYDEYAWDRYRENPRKFGNFALEKPIEDYMSTNYRFFRKSLRSPSFSYYFPRYERRFGGGK